MKKLLQLKKSPRTFFIAVILLFFSISTYSHVTRIRVKQNQNGSLTWRVETYHSASSCGVANSGIRINGVSYQLQTEGSMYESNRYNLPNDGFSLFANATSSAPYGYQVTLRSYGEVTTPYIPGNLNVQPYSSNVCWAFSVGGNGSFTPPPPPVCTSFPLTSATTTIGATNDNGTPCDLSDDTAQLNITAGHLACGNITGDKKFQAYLDSNGSSNYLGEYSYNSGVTTPLGSVTVNAGQSYNVRLVDNDFAGNVYNHSANSFSGVLESTPPTITLNGPASETVAINGTYNDPGATAADDCGSATVNVSGAVNTSVAGNYTLTYTAVDPSGNVSNSVSRTVEVIPIFANAKDITVSLDANGTITIQPGDLDDGSVLGGGTLSIDKSSFDCSNVGNNTVTLTVTSGSSSVSDVANVTVIDDILPTVITQDISIDLDANGNATITTTMIDNGSFDNCAIASFALDNDTFSCTNVGNNQVTLTVTDVHNNVSSATANVTVNDVTAPTVTTNNITIELDENGAAVITPEMIGSATDNCDVTSLTLDISEFDCSNIGENTVTLTATDPSGNTNSSASGLPEGLIGHWKFDQGNELTDLTGNWGDLALIGNVSISNGELDVNNGGYVKSTSYNGATIGNKTLISYVSLDNLALRAGSAITLDAINVDQFDGIIYAEQQPNRWMNGSSYFRRTQALNPGYAETVANQKVMVAITYEQVNGSQVKVSFYRDGVAYGSYISNNFATWSAGNAEILFGTRHTIGSTPRSALDAHIDEAMIYDRALTASEISTIQNGTSNGATAIVTVVDNILPTVITQDISVNLDENGSVSITTDMIDNGSFDNCAIASYALDNDTFSCTNVGDNQVTLTVTDVNGNVSSATANVVVNDVTSPTVITQTATVTLANGEASISTFDVDGGTFDNCSFTLSLDNDMFTCSDIGENTVTLTATDASGNTSSQTATVNVVGDIPTISINDFNAVQTQKKNTIFLGFGPSSINLSTVVSGGSGFTYEWTASTGESVSSEANPSVSPVVSTTYNVVVTNSNGCTASTSIYVCVIDARAFDKKGRYKGKVIVCHHTSGKKGTKHVEIEISASAVMTHLTKHGVGTDHADSLGACNATCVGSSSGKGLDDTKTSFTASISDNLNVYPNPSQGIFDIRLTGVGLETNIMLFDINGKLLERKMISAENSEQNIITIGNYNLSSGIYLLKIVNQDESVTKKLLVTKD